MTTPPVPPRNSGLLAIVSAKETLEGWQLVPVEMTPAMLAAAVHATNTSNDWLAMKRRWNAALEAAPAPPVAIAHEAVDLPSELIEEAAAIIYREAGRYTYYPETSSNLRFMIAAHNATKQTMLSVVDRLRAFLAAPTASDRPVVRAEDAKDAERYRFWRKFYSVTFAISGRHKLSFRPTRPQVEIAGPFYETVVDAAIDTAMLADRAAPQ